MDIGHVMQLTTSVKTLDELCKFTRSTDAQLISLRNQAISSLAVWTHALDQRGSLCVRDMDGSDTVGSDIAKA